MASPVIGQPYQFKKILFRTSLKIFHDNINNDKVIT